MILSKLFLLVIGSHLVDWSETVRVCGLFFHRVVNPLTPLFDQNWISPYNIMQTSDGIKKYINNGITNWSDTKFSKLT